MKNYNGRNGNGYQPLPDISGKKPQPPIGDTHKCQIVDGPGYEGALMYAAVNEIENLRKTIAATRKDADKYYQLWQSVIRYHENKTVKERDRLRAEVEALRKCCTQRGARMQIMREWMAARHLWPAFWPKYDAHLWFDGDGVPVEDAALRGEGE